MEDGGGGGRGGGGDELGGARGRALGPLPKLPAGLFLRRLGGGGGGGGGTAGVDEVNVRLPPGVELALESHDFLRMCVLDSGSGIVMCVVRSEKKASFIWVSVKGVKGL